jgi:predicted metalloprotease with PDZ domain
MLALWSSAGDGRGVTHDDILRACSTVAGVDATDTLHRLVRSTAPLPLPELLATAGITWRTRPTSGDKDTGGKPGPAGPHVACIGARFGAAGRLDAVTERGPAWQAGLSAGDVVVAIDNIKVSDLGARIRALPPGQAVTVHAFRRDELLTTEVTPTLAPSTTVWLELTPDHPNLRWFTGAAATS